MGGDYCVRSTFYLNFAILGTKFYLHILSTCATWFVKNNINENEMSSLGEDDSPFDYVETKYKISF